MIVGESGTGKELIARTTHQMSQRVSKPFVAVNCGAIPTELFESEFFGHCKGAFTGATSNKPGYFEKAHQGTLFLDEIGELPSDFQVKLLRVLESGEYTPVGGHRVRHADVRILTATNRDIHALRHSGVMRNDFFYRLHVIIIQTPPLRECPEDVPLLVEHILAKDHPEHLPLPQKVLSQLSVYHWPGNVRELRNVLLRYIATGNLSFSSGGNVLPLAAIIRPIRRVDSGTTIVARGYERV